MLLAGLAIIGCIVLEYRLCQWLQLARLGLTEFIPGRYRNQPQRFQLAVIIIMVAVALVAMTIARGYWYIILGLSAGVVVVAKGSLPRKLCTWQMQHTIRQMGKGTSLPPCSCSMQ